MNATEFWSPSTASDQLHEETIQYWWRKNSTPLNSPYFHRDLDRGKVFNISYTRTMRYWCKRICSTPCTTPLSTLCFHRDLDRGKVPNWKGILSLENAYTHISIYAGKNSCQSWTVLGPTRDGVYSLYPAIHETNETQPYVKCQVLDWMLGFWGRGKRWGLGVDKQGWVGW